MLSTLKLRRFAWYLIGAADVSPFFAYSDEPGTMFVWADADWSGNEMTCKSASDGAAQLEYYGIEAWSVVQQVESGRIIAGIKFAGVPRIPRLVPKVWLSKRSKLSKKCQIRLTVSKNEAKCTRRTKEKLLGDRKALESLTQKVAIAVAEFAFASPREPPDKMSPGQDALENAKECPSDLDTRVQEREAMPRRVSKHKIVAVTSRFATPWNTRAQWSCFICGLARTASASDEVMVRGYWLRRGNGTTTGVVEVADSIPTFAVNAGAGGAVAEAMLVWRVALSSCSVWSRQMRPSAEVQLSTRKREIERCVRQVDWRVLSAHRWVRQRASHNRSSPYPQVTDHGLLSEHQ